MSDSERNATDAELESLYSLTHDFVIRDGQGTPSLGFQGFAPDGHPVAIETSSFELSAPAHRISRLEPEAARRLGLGLTGKLTATFFEPAYLADQGRPVETVPLDDPTLIFSVYHGWLARLRATSYMMTKPDTGTMHASVSYEPRSLGQTPPSSPLDRVLAELDSQGEGIPYRDYTDLSLIMSAWRKRGPAIGFFSRRRRKQ